MNQTELIFRVASAPCGASDAFMHPACAHGLQDVTFHDLTIGELLEQQIVSCDSCGERILPKGVTAAPAIPLCPECGSTLDVEAMATISEEVHPGYHVAGTPLPRRERTAAVAFCTGCEFCIEIGK